MRVWVLSCIGLLGAALPAAAQQMDGSPHGKLPDGMDCIACHTSAGWKPMRAEPDFDHAKQARFELSGKHALLGCKSCHTDARFDRPRAGARDCVACHVDLHQGRLSRDCASCHNPESFARPAGSDVHSRTRFPLTGRHAQVQCEGCHRGEQAGGFTVLDNRCISCHQSDYQAAPSHSTGGFPRTCEQCHTTSAWTAAAFDHNTVGFPLTGAHLRGTCANCHLPGGQLIGRPAAPSDCIACHRAQYEQEHTGSGFPQTCLACHNDERWTGATFDHAAASAGFSLLGAHLRASCSTCHEPGTHRVIFNAANQNDCYACHRTQYDAEHGQANYPTNCLGCHNVDSWTGATFTHNRFPLTGPHSALPCESCHAPPNNALIFPVPSSANDCVACHRADYDREHTGTNFPTTCTSCHSGNSWTGATFNHVQFGNGYALVGVHGTLQCSACHGANNTLLFNPTSNNDCMACHQADYNAEHSGSGYPTTCTTCHTQTTWGAASFDHDAQFFPIYSGKHQGKWSTCTQCHPTPTNLAVFTCLTCHTKTETDNKHQNRQGYVYDSVRCLACHPRGD